MAEDAPSTSAGSGATAAAAPSDELLVNLSIVSPSLTVNSPLKFPGLPPSTTVGELKAKIRDALDSKPSNDKQRLIHQGKLLVGENDTLLQVFGEQKIRDSEQLILHLVIREAADQSTLSSQSPARNPEPRAPTALSGGSPPVNNAPHNPAVFNHIYAHGPHIHQHVRLGRPGIVPGHAPSPFGPGFAVPAQPPGIGPMAPNAQQQQHLINQHLINQHLIHQAQLRDGQMRAQADGQSAMGANGLGRNSPHPDPHHGDTHHITVNSTAFSGPHVQVHQTVPPYLSTHFHPGNMPHNLGGSFTQNDVHNILRNADANHATSMMTNAMHRSASGASLANLNLSNQRQPIQAPGVTVPRRPGSTIPLSRTATPDNNNTRTPSGSSSNLNPTSRTTTSSQPAQPEVYILSSPLGPRALLVHGSSEMYYTPIGRTPLPSLVPHFPPPPPWLHPQARMLQETNVGQPAAQTTLPAGAGAPAAEEAAAPPGNIRVNLYQGPQVQQQGQPQQQPPEQQPLIGGGMPMHPANPEGGVAGALLAALWPHLWLLIRLAIFVWWFTSSDTSWTRWATIMLLATAVFLFNTGLFNRMANEWLNPLRQHLEGLLPLVGPELNRNGANNDNAPGANAPPGPDNQNGAPRQPGEPDPTQVAARLVEQHRQRNANWLLDIIRRLERAGLLFLASIAPGVAERHIAVLEAAERAERERQEAAERAERERVEAEAAAAANPADGGDNNAGPATDALQDGPSGQASGEGADEQQQPPPPPVATA